jgi:uncharacterized protein YgiM (DUF1202 family)
MLSTSLLAQTATNTPSAPTATPPAAGAPVNAPPAALAESNAQATNTPSAKPAKKKNTKKKSEQKPAAKRKDAAADLKTVPLVAGPAIVDAKNVNVRGQSKLNSEVVTRLTKGDQVTVIEEVTHNNSGPDEPSAWAKIALPAKAHGWVNTPFIDSTNKTVIPKKLNVRSGPGENYSILGRLEKGDAVKEVGTKGEWTEIEAPTNAYAFVAAQYLKQEPAGLIASTTTTTPEPVPTPTPTPPTPTPTPVPESPTITPAPTEVPNLANTNPPPVPAPPVPAADEPPPKRIVQHEGVVRGLTSIQAPSRFELVSPETGKTIDYLFTTSRELDLRRYKGLRIVVTGEEGLDERWGNTPVITIQKIQVVE